MKGSSTSGRHVLPRLTWWLSHATAAVSGVCLLVLLGWTVADVVLRKVTGSGFSGTVEWAEVLLAVAVFAGLMSTEMHRTNIRTPLVTSLLPARPAHVLRAVGFGLCLVLTWWGIDLSARLALDSIALREVKFGIAAVPIWPAKAMIPIGLSCLFLALLHHLVASVRAAVRSTPQSPDAAVAAAVETAKEVGP